jgi:hypothetical protein
MSFLGLVRDQLVVTVGEGKRFYMICKTSNIRKRCTLLFESHQKLCFKRLTLQEMPKQKDFSLNLYLMLKL